VQEGGAQGHVRGVVPAEAGVVTMHDPVRKMDPETGEWNGEWTCAGCGACTDFADELDGDCPALFMFPEDAA